MSPSLHLHAGGGHLQHRAHLRVAFLLERLLHERQHRRACVAKRPRRGQPLRRIARIELECAQRARHGAAQPVVGNDLLALAFYFLAGKDVASPVVAHYDDPFLNGMEISVGESLQKLRGLRVAFRDKRGDRLDLLVAVAEREFLDRRGIQGPA